MIREVCLISVPHTGTMFVREIFVSNGWADVGLNADGSRFGKPVIYQGHCEKPTQVHMALDLSKRMPLVSPMRHPYRVEESWRRRPYGGDLARLHRAYYQLLHYIAARTRLWIPVDGMPLCKHIAHKQLNEIAGKEMKVDWNTLVNAEKNTHAVPLHELSPSKEIRDIRAHRLFTTWYGGRENEDEVLGIARAAAHADSGSGEGCFSHAD